MLRANSTQRRWRQRRHSKLLGLAAGTKTQPGENVLFLERTKTLLFWGTVYTSEGCRPSGPRLGL